MAEAAVAAEADVEAEGSVLPLLAGCEREDGIVDVRALNVEADCIIRNALDHLSREPELIALNDV